MASRISQMRNAANQLPPQAIEQARNLMNMAQATQNPQAFVANLLQNNPRLAAIVQGGNLQGVAQQMARQQGIDLDNLISQLQGGQL